MLTQQEIGYRELHGVVPSLDRVNNKNWLSLIPQTPVVYSRYANMGNGLKNVDAKNIAGGVGNAMLGVLALGTGNFGYAAGKFAQGVAGTAAGVINSASPSLESFYRKALREDEERAWNRYNYLREFVPASGNLGDVYLRDGSCDDFHCGNGYKIFSNGDYFEGYWVDGEPSVGIYIWADGERYWGGFVNWKRALYGLTIYTSGSYYDGEYDDGECSGTGTRWYMDGVYCGEWQNGLRQGSGMCWYADGTTFCGDWEDDEPIE